MIVKMYMQKNTNMVMLPTAGIVNTMKSRNLILKKKLESQKPLDKYNFTHTHTIRTIQYIQIYFNS